MNALRQLLYRGGLSCAICYIIALTLYNMTHHDNIKHRQPPVWNCHSDDTHSENKHGEICHSEHQHSENRNSEDEHSDNCQNEVKTALILVY